MLSLYLHNQLADLTREEGSREGRREERRKEGALTPFTMYTMVVTAENSVGPGPYSELLNIQSEEAGDS